MCQAHRPAFSISMVRAISLPLKAFGETYGKRCKAQNSELPQPRGREDGTCVHQLPKVSFVEERKFLDTSNLPSVGSFGSKRHPAPPLPSRCRDWRWKLAKTLKSPMDIHEALTTSYTGSVGDVFSDISYLVSWRSKCLTTKLNFFFPLICSICQFPWCKHSC